MKIKHLRILQLLISFFVFGITPIKTYAQLNSLLTGSSSKTAGAAKGPQNVILTADTSTRDSERETAELDGHIQVIYGDQHLSAEHALVNLRAKTVDAIGNVLLVTEKATIGGKRITLDLESNTGVIYEGYVQSGAVSFEGKILYRLSETEFIADDAHYTTCTNCPESWAFSGSRIRAELGGYAYIKNSLFSFGGVPIFYLPYMVVPLKSDRQSGLLPPSFERSNVGGLAVADSYFWAIDRSHDATITAKDYELRGPKGMLNYRYALGPHSGGELDSSFMKDAAFAKDPRFMTFNPNTDAVNRWFVHYNHYQELPDNYVYRLQVENASDLQYPTDFPMEVPDNLDPAMETRMTISHNTDNISWMMDSSYYTNLLQSNPMAGNNDAVQRLPELRAEQALTKVGDSDFLFSWYADYTNFARSSWAFDSLNQGYTPNSSNTRYIQATDVTGSNSCNVANWETLPQCREAHDAIFNSNRDLLRTGTRLDANIDLQRPFQAGKLDIVPKISFRETDYEFNAGTDLSAVREYARGDITARTVFSSIYGSSSDPNRIKHEFQPEVSYSVIPWMYQPNHPFFGATANASPYTMQNSLSDSDFNSPYGIQFDYEDRTYNHNIVTYGFSNRLIRKSLDEKKQATYTQFFNWRVAQSYDFYQAAGNPPYQPWTDIVTEMTLTLPSVVLYNRQDYFPYQQVNDSSNKIRYRTPDSDFYEIGYDLYYPQTPGVPINSNLRTDQVSLKIKHGIKFVDLIGKIIYDLNPQYSTGQSTVNSFGVVVPTTSNGGQTISGYGVAAQIRMPGNCMFFNLQIFRPSGSTTETFTVGFDFSFDGITRPQLQESVIDGWNL